MKNIELYIGGMRADIDEDFECLFNWTETDLSNPTYVKNGYSKTCVLKSSNANSEIFGHFWNLERSQEYGGGLTRTDYNPTWRVPFILYYNGNIYERGYCKLQKVVTNNKETTFEVGLFGGLGSFIYNLETNWENGGKKTLADLDYGVGSSGLSFTINKETIYDAWANVNNTASTFSKINFCPTYAGIPTNLDADKVLINLSGTNLTSSTTKDNKTYKSYGGYALGKLPDKLTAEEVKDYRSYLQTPCIRVKSIIAAICDRNNNKGQYDNGFDVVLDEMFFNQYNPFYERSWMTLSGLKIETTQSSTSTPISPVAYQGFANTGNGMTYVFALPNEITENWVSADITFDLEVYCQGATASTLELVSLYNGNSYGIQAYASNSNTSSENVFAASNIIWLMQNANNTSSLSPDEAIRRGIYVPKQNADAQVIDGRFAKNSGYAYRFTTTIHMSTPLPRGTRYLKIDVQRFNYSNQAYANQLYDWFPYNRIDPYNAVLDINPFANASINILQGQGTNFPSQTYVSQASLLSTSFSPAEWLISFVKHFGLILHKDLVEDKIYIDTRDTFYKRNNIINIDDRIDIGKDLEIDPIYAESNFYSMTNKSENSDCEVNYSTKYGKVYGQKVFETGNEFNADTTELVDSVLKSAIQVKEQSQYYFKKNQNNPYVYNGFSYLLYENGVETASTTTIEISKKNIINSFYPFDGDAYFDVIAKPQFRDKDKKGLNTEGVMVFLNKFPHIVSGLGYYITDDIGIMNDLNNNPCWLMTNSEYDGNGTKIAIKIDSIPNFSRYFEGNHIMLYSWDYGSPRQLYIPDYENNDQGNVFYLYFENYYKDLYDVNTKVVTANVKFDEVLTEEHLRNIYWFRNGLWRLNRVYDYSPENPDSTRCEFIKIQDLDNYTTIGASSRRTITITLDRYEIGQSGGTIIGSVRTSDNFGWNISGVYYDPSTNVKYQVSVSPNSMDQSGNFTISVPRNIRDDRVVTIKVVSDDASGSTAFSQSGVPYTFSIQPTSLSFSTKQQSKTTNITNPYYYNWSVVAKPSWITASPTGITNGDVNETGNTAVTITASKNTTEVERTGSVVFNESTYGHNYTLSVSQAGYVFSISPTSANFAAAGESKTITINNPYGYAWSVTSKPSWITTAITGGNLVLTASKNIVFERTGSVVITETDFNKTYAISVSQENGYVFSIQPTLFSFDDISQTKTLQITNPNQMSWTITNIPNWITCSPTAGTGTSVSVTAAENQGFERTFSGISVNEVLCDQHYLFNVQQESGYHFVLLPTTGLSFTSASSTQNITISCRDYHWSITSKPAWITASVLTGYGATNVSLTASKNVGYARSGVIKVKDTDYNLEYTLNISQESGYVFNVSPTTLDMAGTGESKTIVVTNPNGYPWYINGLANWLTATPTGASVSSSITITAAANGGAARYDDFEIIEDTYGYGDADIRVNQASGYSFSIYPHSLTFPLSGATKQITITNPFGYTWSANTNVNWLTLSPTGGTGTSLQVTAGNNSTDIERDAVITIKDRTNNKTYTANVEQEGYEFDVYPPSFTFSAAGETTYLHIYNEQGFSWQMTSYPNWVTPNATAGTAGADIRLIVPNNSGMARSGNIVIKDTTNNRTFTIPCSQATNYRFSVSPTAMSFASGGGSATLTITNPDGYYWAIEDAPSWLSFNKTTGTTSAEVIVTAAANTSMDERTSYFFVNEDNIGYGSTDVDVTQAGQIGTPHWTSFTAQLI